MHIRDANPSDSQTIARITIDSNRKAFAGLVPEQCLNCITEDESSTNWRRTIERLPAEDCLKIAHLDQDILGFALSRNGECDPVFDTELRVISVAFNHQRHGVGRQLVRAVVAHVSLYEVHSMMVRVIALNPNRAFYERMGAEVVRDQETEWGGVKLPEVVYGWRDLRPMLTLAR